MLLVVVPLAAIATHREVWPVCVYSMFSRVRQPDTITRLRVYGVEAGRPETEIPLVKPEQLRPFDSARLQRALERIGDRKDSERFYREALLDLGTRYEKLRRSGGNHGPALQAIRLYRVTWCLDPQARNVDRPEERRLLAETAVPDV